MESRWPSEDSLNNPNGPNDSNDPNDLLCAQQQDRDLHQVADAVGGGAVEQVVEEAVAVRRHRDQVDLPLFGERESARSPGSPIASSVVDREGLRPSARACSSLEIGAVGLHLLRLAQLQLIEVARRPAVGDVDEQQLGAGQPRQLAARASRIVRSAARVLDGDEDAVGTSACYARRTSGRAARRSARR